MRDAERDYQEAVDRLAELKGDRSTPAAELAGKLSIAREAVRVTAIRLAEERFTERNENAKQLAAEVLKLREEARETLEKAEHARATAEGTLAGLYGGPAAAEVLRMQHGMRPVKAEQLAQRAADLKGYAEQKESEAKRMEPRPGFVSETVASLIEAAGIGD